MSELMFENEHTRKYRVMREKVGRSPLKAIRAKCWDCSGGQWSEVNNCEIDECALWLFRSGKRLPKVT